MARKYRKDVGIQTMHAHGSEGNPHRHKQAEHDSHASGFHRRRRSGRRRGR